MFRTIIAIAVLLNATALNAQKADPRGIYHMVSITGRNGTEPAPYDQYKICTDSMTWMVSITEDGQINEQMERVYYRYFRISDNDHMVFNYTGELPDINDSTKTRIYDSNKKGFTLKWWSTSPNHSVFPHNAWCTEQYAAGDYSDSGKAIFDMLYSTKTKYKKDGLQGRWRVVGAIKMSGKKLIDQWQKSGNIDLSESDYVPYWEQYAIIDDQFILTACTERLKNQQPPVVFGYLNRYESDDYGNLDVNDSKTVRLVPKRQWYSILKKEVAPLTYVFHRISDDRMIVEEERMLLDYKSRELQSHIYEIWERTNSRTPIIKQLTSASPIPSLPAIEPHGLYRYVAGGTPCRIRELRDSAFYDAGTEKWSYIEMYRLCTDTIAWNIDIQDNKPSNHHAKSIMITETHTTYSYAQTSNVENPNKCILYGLSEFGFSESLKEGVCTYDNRANTPVAKELLDVLEGTIPYDATYPLYGTWEVVGQVLNPSETKIDSITKGLFTNYAYPYFRDQRVFYAFTPELMYTMRSSNIRIDKVDSDGKTSFVTLEPYKPTPTDSGTLIDVNWSVHWVDGNTILIYRDKQDLLLPIPKCFVLKRKVGGTALINVIGRRPPSGSHI